MSKRRAMNSTALGLFALALATALAGCDARKEPAAKPAAETATSHAPEGKAAPGSVTYEDEKYERDGTPMTRLVATVNGKRLEYDGDVELMIDEQRDFNGDGVMDALITTSSGGNAVPEEHLFVSIADGEIVTAPLEIGNYKIVEEGGRALVRDESDEATVYWGFDGRKAVKVRSEPHRKLETIAQIDGKGAMYSGSETEILKADLNQDGKPDRVECVIWARWGSYTACTLPLPGGKTQDVEFAQACERVGVLKTTSNGYRDLVCNNNAVIRFDGKAWVQARPAP